MTYKLTVTRQIDNPDYSEKALEEYNQKSSYNHIFWDEKTMSKKKEVTALVVDLTEDQFNAIRKSVIEVL